MNKKITLVLICSLFIAINSIFAQTENRLAVLVNGTYTVSLSEVIPAGHTAKFFAGQSFYAQGTPTGGSVTFTLNTPGQMGIVLSGGSGAEFITAVGYKLFRDSDNVVHSTNAVIINFGDVTPPTITLNTPVGQTIEVGSAYSELNATASDSLDGDLSGDIAIDASAVNTNIVDSYSVTYNVSDLTGNLATETRTVSVVDNIDPVISLNTPGTQTLEVEDSYTELGATADDNYDGNGLVVTTIDASNVVAGTIGVYQVTYNYTDANGNDAETVIRTVEVVDTTNPTAVAVAGPIVVNLNGATTITTGDVDNGSSDNYVAGGFTLSLDKDTFTCADLGANTVTLTVTDSSNNTGTATVVVNVIDDVAPMNVTLVNPAYVHPTGTGYVEQGITSDEVCLDRMEIVSSDLDVNQWGTYTIVYKLVDTSGNESDPITRTQVVNNVPTTDAANYTVNQDTVDHIFDVLVGDSFGPDGPESFVISGAMSVENGTLILNDNGTASDPTDDTVTYSPRATYNGTDSFSYTIEDENGDTATRTVNIVVRPIVPVPVDDTATVDKNSSDNIIAVLGNDDFGGNEAHAVYPLTFTNGSTTTSASNNGASLSIDDNNTPNNLTDDVILYTPAADFVGEDTFQYTLTDADGDGTSATVTVTVEEGNIGSSTPTAVADPVSAGFNSATFDINVLANDTPGTDGYIDGGLTMPNGTLTGNSTSGAFISVNNQNTASTLDDVIEYTPVTDFSGEDTFNYTITDDTGDASTATVTVTVQASSVPTANNDTVFVDENSTDNDLEVLVNDNFGAEGRAGLDYLTVVAASNTNGATITVAADNIVYTPAANFTGDDTFTYTITDGIGQATTAEVTVTVREGAFVNDVPTAVDDPASVAQDGSVNIDVLNNDSFGNDGPTTKHMPLTTTKGWNTQVTANGGVITMVDNRDVNDPNHLAQFQPCYITYTPAVGFSGTDTFEYIITDASGDADRAEVTVTVTGPTAIIAVNDEVTVDFNSVGNEIFNLSNDLGVNNSNGSTNITIEAISFGPLSDGGSVSQVDGGVVSLNDDHLSYTPANGFSGTETFTYTLTYNNGASTATATVTVTVGDSVFVNDTPTAVDDSNETAFTNTLKVIDVLSNDTPGTDGYIDGGLTMLNGTLTSASEFGGAISIDNQGTTDTLDDEFNYTSAVGFVGTDTFSYTITDGNGDASSATVTVEVTAVTDVPSTVADVATVDQDSSNNTIDVLDNDSFGTDGQALNPLTVTGTSTEGGTTVVVGSDVEYTPAVNFVGEDTFEYTIEDGNGDTATGTVTVTVEEVVVVNGTPTAVADSVTASQDSSDNVLDVLDNDSYGTDGATSAHSPLTMTNGSVSGGTTEGGTISVIDNTDVNAAHYDANNPDYYISYTPLAGYSGADTFSYTITDASGDASTAEVTVTVTGSNTITAVDDSVTVDFNSVGNSIFNLSNDLGVNNSNGSTNITIEAISFGPLSDGGSVSQVDGGVLSLNDDHLSYTPANGFSGTETFTYTLTYNNGASTSTATVTVTVDAEVVVNGTPTAVADTANVSQDSSDNVIDVLDNDDFGLDGAIDGGLTMTNGSLTSASEQGGAISIDNKGTEDTLDDEFNYSAPTGYSGVDTFMYTITDASGDASTGTVTVNVSAVILGYTPDTATVDQDSSDNEIDVMANDTDDAGFAIDDVRFLIESVDHLTGTTANGGTVTLNTNSTPNDTSDDVINYTPRAGFHGEDTFNYVPGNDRNALVLVTVTVTEVIVVNGTPTAVADTENIAQDSSDNVIDVLDNDDFGTDGANVTHPLTIPNGGLTGVSAQGGTLSVEDNGTALDLSDDVIFYTPAAGFSGTDTFTYTITDVSGDAATGTVTLTVSAITDVPTAVADIATADQDSSNNVIDVLDNDSFGTDGQNGTPIALTSLVTDEGGAISLDGNNDVLYTPLAGFTGDDTFTYTIEDLNNDTSTATVTITVGAVVVPNGTPTAVDDTISIVRAPDLIVSIDVLDNDDFGTDGPNLTHPLTLRNGKISEASAQGRTITVENGVIKYYASNNPSLTTDSFTYTITDANGDAATATVNITMTASKSAGVNFGNNTTILSNQFLAYPNPTKNGKVNVALNSSVETSARVLLFDVNGKIIYQSAREFQRGINTINIDVNVKPGILFLKVISSEVNFGTKKVIFK